MARTWVDGELITAAKLNQYGSDLESLVVKTPYINETTKTWMVYDAEEEEYVDTGIIAEGEDGVSPTISTNKVGKVTTVTVVDAEGTKTFEIQDGADGQGTGDMTKAAYDPTGAVEQSGGIPLYIESNVVINAKLFVFNSIYTQEALELAQEVYDYFTDGNLPIVKIGHNYYFPDDSVMERGLVVTTPISTIAPYGGIEYPGYIFEVTDDQVTEIGEWPGTIMISVSRLSIGNNTYNLRTGTSGASGYITIETE